MGPCHGMHKLELDFPFRLIPTLANLILVCFLNLFGPFHFPLLVVTLQDLFLRDLLVC
jgi:hypothetical protein